MSQIREACLAYNRGMTARLHSRSRQRYRATFALVAFVAATLVGLLAPLAQTHAYELVCTAQGNRLIALPDGSADPGHPPAAPDHAAHCPLCMPVGAPPAELVWDFTPVQPLAFVDLRSAVARTAAPIGAPLPARGPPLPT